MRIRLVALNARYVHSCLALFYLRNELRRHLPGAELSLDQFTINDPYYETLLSVSCGRPDAVMLSVYIWNRDVVLRLVHDLARLAPSVAVIVGGPEAAGFGSGELPAGCTVVRGEIEGIESAFYNDLQNKTLKPSYDAMIPAAFAMPFDDDDFSISLKNRYIYYESSRGCPFSCSYCLSAAEKTVRAKETVKVCAELLQILKHRPRLIKFVDRTFNISAKRALAIWRFLLDEAEHTRCHFEVAPDLFSEEMFDFLAKVPSGRFQFEVGVQSTHKQTLDAISRPMNSQAALDNIARLASLDNIHVHADLILGLPYETEVTYKKSFNDVFRSRPHYIQMGLLKVLPNTPICATIEQYGLIHSAAPPYSILQNRWLDHETMRRLYFFGECVEAFCNNRFFRSTLEFVRKNLSDPAAFFEELLDFCMKRNFFQLAKTQEVMSGLLAEFARNLGDQRGLFLELLRYDWLRCGHRFLPEHLRTASFDSLRADLRRTLPPNLPPHYDYQERDEFLKRSMFLNASIALLKETGLAEDQPDGGVICFLPERTTGFVPLQKTILLPA